MDSTISVMEETNTKKTKIEVTKIIEIREGIETNNIINPETTLEIVNGNAAIERDKMTNPEPTLEAIKDSVVKNNKAVLVDKMNLVDRTKKATQADVITAGSSVEYAMVKAMTG